MAGHFKLGTLHVTIAYGLIDCIVRLLRALLIIRQIPEADTDVGDQIVTKWIVAASMEL